MWSHFRAIAARVGLSREVVEEVERGGVPTLVRDPLNPDIQYRVRPDPDWTERLGQAWEGILVNSRRESAGTLPVPDGLMLVAALSSPDEGVTVRVAPGEYEVVLTIAHVGSEETYDYSEYVSHVFALLRGNEGAAAIEPLTDEQGSELGLEAHTLAFAGAGVLQHISATYPGGRIWTLYDIVRAAAPDADISNRHFARAVTDDGSGALIAVSAGEGGDDYPFYRIADEQDRTIGIMVDFWVDNRPHEPD
ncbi:MAG TPA: hypothetical protein VFR28_06860 [Allosphingosinicella sp.]|nr:hypothetical protein [Allosphingosinicella sp.]